MEIKSPEKNSLKKTETGNTEKKHTGPERRQKPEVRNGPERRQKPEQKDGTERRRVAVKNPEAHAKARGFDNAEAKKYHYELDKEKRVRRASGTLRLEKENERNPRAQLQAGGEDRRLKDNGGHYIARVFGGSPDEMNLFAQDGHFNKSDYRKLEKSWEKYLSQKNPDGTNRYKVDVDIRTSYQKDSKRPDVVYVYSKVTDLNTNKQDKKIYMFHNEEDTRARQRKLK